MCLHSVQAISFAFVSCKWLLRRLPGLIGSEKQCNKFSVAMKIHFDKLTLFEEPVTVPSCRDKLKYLTTTFIQCCN